MVDLRYTRILNHFEGTDGATSTTDEFGRKWTFGGNAQLDTADKKFGTASLLLDGAGDYIITDDSYDFTVGSGDFTIDCWINPDTVATGRKTIFGQCASGGGTSTVSFGLEIGNTNAGDIRGFVTEGTTTTSALSAGSVITADTWQHVAFVRDGATLRVFVDGTQVATGDCTGVTVNDSSEKVAIGRLGNYAGLYYDGHIDEFRFCKGKAIWTEAFTPPTSAYSAEADIPKVNSASSTDSGSSTSSSLTFSHTVGSDSNRLLVVGVGYRGNTEDVSSVTYGGTALTQLVETRSGSNETGTEIWYLKNPTSGTANVVVTMTGATYCSAGAIDLYDVDQTETFGDYVTSGAIMTSISDDVTSNNNELVIDIGAKKGNTDGGMTEGTVGQIEWVDDYSTNATATNNVHIGMSTCNGGVVRPMSWTWSGTSRYSSHIAVPVRYVSADDASNPLATDLLAWWSMDETSGTDVVDSSVNGLDGTASGAVAYSSGKLGYARDFDGINDYINVPDNDLLDPANAVSFATWVQMDSIDSGGSWDRIIEKGANNSFGLSVTSNSSHGFIFRIYTPSLDQCLSYYVPTADGSTWYFVVATYDGSAMRVYVNGYQQNATGAIGYMKATADAVRIGNWNDGARPFDGRIDELAMFDDALTPEEIIWLYNGGTGRSFSDLTPSESTFIPKIMIF